MLKQRLIIVLALLGTDANWLHAADEHAPEPLGSLHQEVWRTDEGLPQNTVPAIVQSQDGYLWAGTELGLVRFDGLHFTVFDTSNTPELKANVIDALMQDRRGALWIGTVGGGLTRFADGKFTTFTTRDGLSNDSISSLLEDPSGDIWIGTNGGGLDRLHHGQFSTYGSESGLADNQVFALANDRKAGLWVGTHDGLSRISKGRFRTYRRPDGLPHNDVRSLLMGSDGTLWIGTYGGGLSRLQNGRFTTLTVRNGLTSNSVVSLSEAPDGDLWIGTLRGGVTRLSRDGLFSSYTSKNGLPINDVWCVYHDREQNVWLGTGGGGLVRLNRSAFTAYTRKDGLSDNVTLAVFEDHAGTTWIGTNSGGLNRFRNGRFISIGTKSGLADDLVFTVGEGLDDSLWIGGRKGLNRLKDGKLETFTRKKGLPNDIVTVVQPDSQGALWIGTRAGLSRFKDQNFTTFTTKDGLSSNVVQALYEDRKRRLWIGTSGGGLDLFENGRFYTFDKSRGLPNNVVMAIHEDGEGTLWVGTDGGGLVRLKNNRLISFTTRDGLVDDAIFSMVEDNIGNLWMSSNRGIFRASLKALNDFAAGKIARVPVISYGTRDGMKTTECNGGFQPAAWKSHDGRLWFSTMHGVVVTDPRKLASPGKQQSIFIEQVLADERQVQLRSGVRIPPSTGKLEFHFSAPRLSSGRRINFRYRLEGFESGWVQAGQRRTAYYTNIPPGPYRFKVEATNEDGTWSSAEASLPLTLEPHFYQTFFFYALCSFIVVGAGVTVHLLRTRSLREREHILEQHVLERTVELRNEVAERQRAELESVKAKEAAERASQVKGEFLANMSHEIRTPMNGILGMTRLALGTELNPQQRQCLEVVQDASTALLRVIDDILDFSKVEAGKLELDAVDFVLREHLESALKSLALQAQQKGVELSLHVDSDVPPVIHSDPLRLRQIILNLAGNGLKFTEKGSVTVHVGCEALSASDLVLKLAVIDTGVGIPSDKLISIFEAFSQADTSTSRKFGGTGLGLAICDRLVRLLGGCLWVRSEFGKGSEFHFTIKAGLPSANSNESEDSSDGVSASTTSLAVLAAVGGPERHVLVAEDNPANRMVARMTLEKFGFRVHEVGDGTEAVNAAQEVSFDVILMDCRMPGVDGYEAARQIRTLNGPAGKVPIIALTASAFKEDRTRAEQAGMNDFVAKPFQDAELIQKCSFWAASRNRRAATEQQPVNGPAPKEAEAPSSRPFEKYTAEFIRSLMQIFLETAPPVFQSLVASIEKAEWAQAKTSAHWLRGGASRVISPELQECLSQIEAACTADAPEISKAELDSLRNAFRNACDSAQKWLEEDRAYSTTT
ncbi:MAG: two-component regulator propeller domain-containing protein [Bryobacteraceae bacterium]